MRQIFTLICVASAALASPLAFGQSWTPSKPVRIVVPASGGTVDLVARAVIPALQQALGQPDDIEDEGGLQEWGLMPALAARPERHSRSGQEMVGSSESAISIPASV